MEKRREIINTNPRELANWLSVAFFAYTPKLFSKGYTKALEIDDLYNPLKDDKSCRLGDRLEKQWNAHLKQIKNTNSEPNLSKTLLKTFWLEYVLIGVLLSLTELVLRISQPIFLGKLLDYFSSTSQKTKEEAIWCAVAFIGSVAGNALILNQYMIEGCHVGIKMRAACCSLIYRKTLRLSRTALGEMVPGKVVNLLSNDVSRFEIASFMIPYLLISPPSTLIITYLLWINAGLAGVIGVVPILLTLPFQSYTGRLSSRYRRKTAYKTDERIRLMDEIISGVQVIKMYAWEKPFEKLIKYARQLELKYVKKNAYIRAVYLSLNIFTTKAALFCSLAIIVLSGENLSAAKIFIVVSFYNILAANMCAMFIRGVTELVEVRVNVKRIQDLLMYDEHSSTNFLHNRSTNNAVALNNVTCKWSRNSKENDLDHVNWNGKMGKLHGIIGPVGSGKSSFLQALLGELYITGGDIEINGSISYAPQEAWVFSSSIRQNILFGERYDANRYKQVVKVCDLERDFRQFPSGDLTVVGERGALLSGGQKARINLARAIYRDVDIYLLDDPLSAVDVSVANHLYYKCINGFLANKTRILVTHQVHFLKNAHNIVILNHGKIEAQGKFTELTSSQHFYSKILTTKPFDSTGTCLDGFSMILNRKESMGSLFNDMMSNESLAEIDDDDIFSKEMQEQSSKGKVDGSLFVTYLSGGESFTIGLLVVLLFLVTQVAVSGVDYFLGYWVKLEEETKDQFEKNYINRKLLLIYGIAVVLLFLIALIRSFMYYILILRSSTKLHDRMFLSVINTDMKFFNLNPSGRILNRFSKDLSSMDELLPRALMDCGQILLLMAGSVVLVAIIKPYFLIPTCLLGTVFWFLRKVYLKSSKNVKRVEALSRSPVFTHLCATFQGLTTIRAYKAQNILKEDFEKHLDKYTSSTFMFFTMSYSFGFALDMLCFMFIGFITFTFLLLGNKMDSGDAGLATTQAVMLAGMLNWGVRQSAETINQLMAVERVLEYAQLPPEKQPLLPKNPKETWPAQGKIVFKSVGLRYAENKPYVLNDLNIEIEPSRKIGIVGRTGAGKSSLITALLRLALVDGSIIIDDIKSEDINLQVLRSKISIIPQDPVLFSGTLRYNLDPFDEYSDEVLYKALEEVELRNSDKKVSYLDHIVLDRGSNYSVGQRQLICLARAIVRNNKILLMDEATANVDPQTDTIIQKTIREKFANCTVLTVAHRLNTIIDSDRVLVMDSGRMVEYDHPHVLLQSDKSLFHKMVAEMGETMMCEIVMHAKQSYFEKTIDS